MTERYKTFALSNFIKESYEFVIQKFHFFSLFDGEVISWKENYIKPEFEIYKVLLRRYKLISQECIFLDDHLNFLKSAEKLGINTLLITTETDSRAKLRKFNVNI